MAFWSMSTIQITEVKLLKKNQILIENRIVLWRPLPQQSQVHPHHPIDTFY